MITDFTDQTGQRPAYSKHPTQKCQTSQGLSLLELVGYIYSYRAQKTTSDRLPIQLLMLSPGFRSCKIYLPASSVASSISQVARPMAPRLSRGCGCAVFPKDPSRYSQRRFIAWGYRACTETDRCKNRIKGKSVLFTVFLCLSLFTNYYVRQGSIFCVTEIASHPCLRVQSAAALRCDTSLE